MLLKLALAAGLMMGAAGMISHSASAAPLAPQIEINQAASEFTPIPVQFGRCRRWREECGSRWGFRSHRYYRCLERHGCGRD
jgi:hypothetical protein